MTTESRPPPDDPGLNDAAAGLVAAYVHVPFCRRVCPYCDFAVVAGREDLAARYVDALVAEIEATPPLNRPLDTVAFGGGTPSRLPAAAVARVLGALRSTHGIAAGAEISLEANPEDWTAALAGGLADAGVDRVSLGVQSFDGSVLEWLGRGHTSEQGAAAVADARRAGFRSVSVDLIFGSPVEDDASWRRSVATALDLEIDHLSCYALTVEPGTPLSRSVRAGEEAPDPDVQADRYETAWGRAEAAGLRRYETSNGARPGHGCLYNLVTWAGGQYQGFGNGAHRHVAGTRSWNVRRVDRYLERVEAGGRATSGQEHLDGWGRERERLVLGLRRSAGAVIGEAGRALLASMEGDRLIAAGVLAVEAGRLRVLRPLLGDAVARAVLGLDPPATREDAVPGGAPGPAG
jgi:oxygen-independent coproporphyrinogen-3 oxidase